MTEQINEEGHDEPDQAGLEPGHQDADGDMGWERPDDLPDDEGDPEAGEDTDTNDDAEPGDDDDDVAKEG